MTEFQPVFAEINAVICNPSNYLQLECTSLSGSFSFMKNSSEAQRRPDVFLCSLPPGHSFSPMFL